MKNYRLKASNSGFPGLKLSIPVLWADKQKRPLTVMTDFPDSKAAYTITPVTASVGLHHLVTS